MNNQFDTEPGDEELNGIGEELLTPEELITPEEFQDWGGSELEAAYLKALSALEASESEIKSENSAEASQQNLAEARLDPIPTSHSSTVNSNTVIRAPGTTGQSDASESANSLSTASLSELMEALPTPNSSRTHQKAAAATSVSDVPMTPRQIIEACLFVGGTALTSKRLCGVLRGDSQAEFVDHEINELNRLYAAENRPYEIRLVEGGYRLSLREEFERIRHKVYGLGPKEVRLSQEALEVLAVVAYHQPINQVQVEEMGKPGCVSVLRQLVRRELIFIERDPAHPREVTYRTTPRFLSLFGLRSLNELPRQEHVSFK